MDQDEDAIVNHRLLIGSSVIGSDHSVRKCADLYSNYIRLLSQPEERIKAQEVLLFELEQFEFEVIKAEITKRTCTRELEGYAALHNEIDLGIEKTTQQIQKLKGEMLDEKVIRKYKEEYEVLAREVNKLPSTKILKEQIEILTEELNEARRKEEQVTDVLGHKAKQFDLVLRTICDLQCSEHEESLDKEAIQAIADQSGEEEEEIEASESVDELVDMEMD